MNFKSEINVLKIGQHNKEREKRRGEQLGKEQ